MSIVKIIHKWDSCLAMHEPFENVETVCPKIIFGCFPTIILAIWLIISNESVWKSIAPIASNSRQLVHEGGRVFSSWNISRHRNHSPTRNTTFVLKIPLLNMTRSHSQATHLTPRECGHRHVLLWAASVSQHSVKLKLGEGRYGPCRYSVLPNPDCWSLVACLR